ncbi:protein kinase domain-containing protein, partial [Pseudonocardia lacus]|uniref:protein kinase domain-containing protein n=1 Tax=Pseudonocardia lacus TaxID=2835865 RepID=UPI001BDD10AE
MDEGHEDSTPHGRQEIDAEPVAGRSLADALLEGPLATDDVVELGAELADALARIHDRGGVHGGVEPAGVLFADDGLPHLADVGSAHLADSAAYMAPEQVRGEDVGAPADVYSLGLVLLEALTGRREYPGPTAEAAVARVRRPPRVPAGLPASIAGALGAMTATDPAARPTAAEVVAMLQAPTLVLPARRRPV